ncbi:MAG: SAM-dependent methyltransferase [Microgenomates group bacterium]|jgi:23S rRNA (cytidine1920-2'-O)/16S rRNA (cytidine1409-2'-O)-methyltransferase
MSSSNFVSRGGDKLQAAIDRFGIDVTGKVALDVGSSTGGFVDCLLQNGAAKVYAVDTAYGEFAWKLRNDPRVVVMERTNILRLEQLPETVDLITIDAGWTKLELILPIVQKFLKPDGRIIALLKPHYEANQRDLVKGILPPEIAEEVRKEVSEKFESMFFKVEDVIESPILGGGGNKEYLLSLLFLKKD